MEEERTGITNKHGKKKIYPLSSLSIGGEGGIAGLLVFGGALAVAGFMAVASFVSNKRKAKGIQDHQPKPIPQQLLLDENGSKTQEDHQTNQNLTSLLQHSNAQHGDATCYWTSDMSIDQETSELLSAQPSILEEKTELKPSNVEESPNRFHHQEIVFSDYSRPESAVSSNESGVGEECLESLLNNSSGQAQEVENDESQDGLASSETEMEDDEVESDDDDDDDYDDDMMSDDVSEDSSKVTGRTSEAVWPAKLIQKTEQKLKGEYCDSDAEGLDYVGDDEAIIVAKKGSSNKKVNLSMVRNGKASIIKNWVYPMLLGPLLMFLLLLLLLARRPQESLYVLDEGTSVILP